MPNILDTIQVSGASYDLKDKNAPSVSSLTQSEYDNLPATAKTSNTFFVITDAQAGDLTNYYTKSETNTLLGGKQATLVSGTNIKTINNESLLGSGNIDIQGGSTYTAGRGIDITNDTISVSLPISAGTGSGSIRIGTANAEGSYSLAVGQGGSVYSNSSLIVGHDNYATSNYSSALGQHLQTKNSGELAVGILNNSTAGNTLFSVGNGTGVSRHNAFEIRQNGDIYLSSGGTDIKLQDHLGGGGSITVDTALDSGSTNPVQNKALYDELRIIESTETVLRWAQSDGGYSSNYPSGCTKVMITVDEQQMTYGAYSLIDSNSDNLGEFNIDSNNGTITVTIQSGNITYSINDNVVTVEYPTITNVYQIYTYYDNFWTWKAIVNNATPLIDKVIENEEVTAAALNVLNDKFDGLKLKKLTQSEYNALSPNYDSNTLYVIVN